MKVGLIDVDNHFNYKKNGAKIFPNIALMKISTYHKALEHHVEIYNQLEEYDIVYVSKVFSDEYSKKYPYFIKAKKIIYGGYGYKNYDTSFINNYEKLMPDYSLYNIQDTSYGFLTKGCPRQCPFCVVGEIDGTASYKVAELSDWHNSSHKYISLSDPNILAYEGHLELLQQLLESKCEIDFNQGLDIRFVNYQNVKILKELKIERFHFAWDNPKEDLLPLFKKWRKKLSKSETLNDYSKFAVYVLVNYNSTFEEDYHRIISLKDAGFDPYVMIYNKPTASIKLKKLQRWTNMKSTFRSCEFGDYQKIDIYVNKNQMQLQF